jgi:hypothetical protein
MRSRLVSVGKRGVGSGVGERSLAFVQQFSRLVADAASAYLNNRHFFRQVCDRRHIAVEQLRLC